MRLFSSIFLVGFLISVGTYCVFAEDKSDCNVRLSIWLDTNAVHVGSKMVLTAKLNNQTKGFISAIPSVGDSLYLIDSDSNIIHKVRSYYNPRWPIDHNVTAGSHWGLASGETGGWAEHIEFDKNLALGNYELQGTYCVTNSDGQICTILSDAFKLKVIR